MKKRTTIYIDEKLMAQFKKYTKERGMNASSRIEILIKRDIENHSMMQLLDEVDRCPDF